MQIKNRCKKDMNPKFYPLRSMCVHGLFTVHSRSVHGFKLKVLRFVN